MDSGCRSTGKQLFICQFGKPLVDGSSTSEVSSPNTTGKSQAYDYSPFSELKLVENVTSSYVIADLSSDSDSAVSLRAVVANTPHNSGDPGCNNGSSAWDNGFQTFTATSRSGSFFSQDYIKIWHGDGDYNGDCIDRAVFSAGSGEHGDWNANDNVGAIGGEFRMSSNNSNWYTVWIR